VTTQTATKLTYDYHKAADAILRELRRDRDRQIIARRFGFGLAKRQTLEKIGSDFDITRERVRQIEKAAIAKIRTSTSPELVRANELFVAAVNELGNVALIGEVAAALDIAVGDEAYAVFLALLAPGVELIDENDDLRAAVTLLPIFNREQTTALIDELLVTIKAYAKPISSTKLLAKTPSEIELVTLEQLLRVSKKAAHFDGKWGLITWPEVNPKSIRDKTYLVLNRHGKPLHFAEIASHIRDLQSGLTSGKRDVTVQAVHNELIKDDRFILIGRGIYALAEWGYTPGTVAEIIASVLRDEAPLHKDEIIKRVLQKRQVKTTTIILNLQEKDQFVRTAKATYALKDSKDSPKSAKKD
jgi:DNA-directed RNA polymerase delta subunit